MERIPEPELMDMGEQAEAYANADFEDSHGRIVQLFDAAFPAVEINGSLLDLGCGPGDVTFRFARRFPEVTIVAVDGSAAMIALANKRREREHEVGKNITFMEAVIPGAVIPRRAYDSIISTSFLHHLHDPAVLWKTVGEHALPGTKLFVYDLFRPRDRHAAMRLVELYADGEPEVLKKDFYNSLLAAFEPKEVEYQLSMSKLSELSVTVVSDRHMIICGERSG
jgi:trans-aconitate methyltransferase